MRRCKNILRLLSFFVFAVPLLVTGETFRAVDFERLLQKHPLMRKYDPETGRFKETKSEIIPVEKLQERVASISAEIAASEREKSDLVLRTMNSNESAAENLAWEKIGQIDRRLSELKERLKAEQSLLEDKGVPGYDKLLEIAGQIYHETVLPEIATGCVLLNKLPRFAAAPPRPAENDLRRFFFSRKAEILESYLTQAGKIALMFEKTDRPILYSADREVSDAKKH
ncbi:MAG TPA: hypothetical protein PKN29_02815 [Candidatus Ozemobacteraceae bacterium]|nr:hypothetical protein [Candidatus Ozemobacteraceae bacterium]